MKFNLIVSGSSSNTQAAYSAIEFAKEVIAAGHTLSQVFFYQEGVGLGNELVVPLADEFNAIDDWVMLAQKNTVKLVVCVSAAERRGVIGESQKIEFEKNSANLHPEFEVAGLGVMLEASLLADRTVTFK